MVRLRGLIKGLIMVVSHQFRLRSDSFDVVVVRHEAMHMHAQQAQCPQPNDETPHSFT
jgi:hypothetical protein